MSQPVSPGQRFRRSDPCPICGGHPSLPAGKGERCSGYWSADGQYAHCTREEYAGGITPTKAAEPTYPHKLHGACRCGLSHADGAPVQRPALQLVAVSAAPRMTQTHRKYLPIATHVYRDAQGAPVFRKPRFWSGKVRPDDAPPKCVVQRPVGAEWYDGLDGQDFTIIYRLPELLAAPERPVWLVEGEKAADALAALGLVATCNADGGKGWKAAHAAQLAGRKVFHLRDADDTGVINRTAVVATLRGVAASVTCVDLPGLDALGDGADVVDWLRAGGDVVTLCELAMTTPAEASTAAVPAPMPVPDPQSPPVIERKHNQRLERALAWRRALQANPLITATHKEVAAALYDEFARLPEGSDGELTPYLPRIAERAGVSPDTASAALKKLAECGALERRTSYASGAGGVRVTRIHVKPPALFATPAQWQPPTPRNHGGKRERCPECGSDAIKEKRHHVCTGCGHVFGHAERWVNDDTSEAADTNTSQDEATGNLPDYARARVDGQLAFPIAQGKEFEAGGDVCALCGSPEIEAFTPSGRPYCAVHLPEREAS